MDIFEIPTRLRPAIRDSWRARESDFIGRFDFIWDGTGTPKLLEYNADTPTIFAESAVGQQLWFETIKSQSHVASESAGTLGQKEWSFNFIQEHLIKGWPKVLNAESDHRSGGTRLNRHEGGGVEQILHVLHPNGVDATATSDSAVEEREHLAYIKNTALQAGMTVRDIDMTELENMLLLYPSSFKRLGEDTDSGQLSSAPSEKEHGERSSVLHVFKSYPYEWLVQESLGQTLYPPVYGDNSITLKPDSESDSKTVTVKFLEPPWKLILGNKALLALLWQLHPDHPNLLYATYDDDAILHASRDEYSGDTGCCGENNSRRFVAKPKYGREGVGVMYSDQYSSNQSFVSDYHRQRENNQYSQEVLLGEPVYQAYQPVQTFNGRYSVLGSWVVRGEAVGICVREDSERTTTDNTSFVPHYVRGEPFSERSHPLPVLSERQSILRRELYGPTPVARDRTSKRQGTGTGSPGGGHGWWWWPRGGGSGSPASGASGASGDATAGGSRGAANKASSGPTTTSSHTHEKIKKQARTYKGRRGSGFGRGAGAGGEGRRANGSHGRTASRFTHSGLG